MTYDAAGNMTSLTDPEGHVTRLTHDIMGNILTREDPRGNVWTYEYDALGRMTSLKDPLNNITRMEYDPMGKIIRRIDPEGRETTFEYNQSGDMVKTVDAGGGGAVFDVDRFGKIFRRTDAEGKETWYTHDSMGRMKTTMDGARNEIKFSYDDGSTSGCNSCSGAYGKVNRITYPSFSREFRYDKRGRRIEEKVLLGNGETHLTEYKYGVNGDLWWTTDRNSNRTSYLYDDLARLTTVKDAMDGETAYTYDNRDNLIALTDANGNTTRFEYDRNDRLVKEIRPMGQETTYAYDGAGNLIEKIDAKGQKTEYVYDPANRLIDTHYYSSGDHANAVKSVSFTYDKVDNLTGYDDGVTIGTYTYDAANRKVSETVDYGDFSLTNNYTYYKNGLKKTFTGPDGVTHQYTYDEANRLIGVQIPDVGYITYSDYDWNQPSSIILPGGTTRELTYDSLMRINSIKVKDFSQNELMNYQYTYDKMNNILSKDTEHGTYEYVYDDLYRLTSADNPTIDKETYTYDAVGNRLTSLDTSGNWAYNENNELGGYDDVTYVYDDNGNMTQKSINEVETKYFYDAENRMVSVKNSEMDGSSIVLEDIVSYYYDPFGRRLWKNVNFYRTNFHYADEGLVGEYDPNGFEIISYGYKPDSMWTTDPIFMKIEENYFIYQNDHLGTPVQVINREGEIDWSAKNSSYGIAEIDYSTIGGNNLRLPGQYFDQETGLYYNFHRYYDPILGRYLRNDPIGMKGGINLFSYGYNNPILYIDPKGLCPPNYTMAENGECWPPMHEGCPIGYVPDPTGHGGCTNFLTSRHRKNGDNDGIYCGVISRAIGICADSITIGSVIATVATGGTASPGTAAVAATARVIAISNTTVTLLLCGPSLSTVTTFVGTATGPPWWTTLIAASDAALNTLGL